jgi:hypothetical protein
MGNESVCVMSVFDLYPVVGLVIAIWYYVFAVFGLVDIAFDTSIVGIPLYTLECVRAILAWRRTSDEEYSRRSADKRGRSIILLSFAAFVVSYILVTAAMVTQALGANGGTIRAALALCHVFLGLCLFRVIIRVKFR